MLGFRPCSFNLIAPANAIIAPLSVQNSNLAQILASFEIKAYNKDTSGIVIDVTDFYNGDIMAIGATDQIRKAYKVITYDATRSYIDTVKTFPINKR